MRATLFMGFLGGLGSGGPGSWRQNRPGHQRLPALPPGYDTDPDRLGSRDPSWRLADDARARTSDPELTDGYPPTSFAAVNGG